MHLTLPGVRRPPPSNNSSASPAPAPPAIPRQLSTLGSAGQPSARPPPRLPHPPSFRRGTELQLELLALLLLLHRPQHAPSVSERKPSRRAGCTGNPSRERLQLCCRPVPPPALLSAVPPSLPCPPVVFSPLLSPPLQQAAAPLPRCRACSSHPLLLDSAGARQQADFLLQRQRRRCQVTVTQGALLLACSCRSTASTCTAARSTSRFLFIATYMLSAISSWDSKITRLQACG